MRWIPIEKQKCKNTIKWIPLYLFKSLQSLAMSSFSKRAKAANLDAIHDTVHEMARDEARHGKAFEGLLKRYFNA